MGNMNHASNAEPEHIFSLRSEFLSLFGRVFALIFASIALWILQFTNGRANVFSVSQFAEVAQGAAQTRSPHLQTPS